MTAVRMLRLLQSAIMHNYAVIMPNWSKRNDKTYRVSVLLFERFSNNCLANTVEPLRAANALVGRKAYVWQFLTLDGGAVFSSSGMQVEPQGALRDHPKGELLILVPSYGFRSLATAQCLAALRNAVAGYEQVVAMDTGSWLLAKAGLLNGRKATIHWQELHGFAEEFPETQVLRERFVIDRDLITCGGAMAAFDVVSTLIGQHFGEALRLEVSWMFMHEGSVANIPATLPTPRTTAVQRAITLMQENLENPLAIDVIARKVGRTQRSLEILFRKELGAPPRTVYRRIRLLTARKLVDETGLPVMEIALRCGYVNPSAMTRAFSQEFGLTPRDARGRAGRV